MSRAISPSTTSNHTHPANAPTALARAEAGSINSRGRRVLARIRHRVGLVDEVPGKPASGLPRRQSCLSRGTIAGNDHRFVELADAEQRRTSSEGQINTQTRIVGRREPSDGGERFEGAPGVGEQRGTVRGE